MKLLGLFISKWQGPQGLEWQKMATLSQLNRYVLRI